MKSLGVLLILTFGSYPVSSVRPISPLSVIFLPTKIDLGRHIELQRAVETGIFVSRIRDVVAKQVSYKADLPTDAYVNEGNSVCQH